MRYTTRWITAVLGPLLLRRGQSIAAPARASCVPDPSTASVYANQMPCAHLMEETARRRAARLPLCADLHPAPAKQCSLWPTGPVLWRRAGHALHGRICAGGPAGKVGETSSEYDRLVAAGGTRWMPGTCPGVPICCARRWLSGARSQPAGCEGRLRSWRSSWPALVESQRLAYRG